jgi:hypothetical protein
MGDRIEHIEIIEGGPLQIKAGDFRRLAEKLEDYLPEITFLNEGVEPPAEMDDNELFTIPDFWWSGSGSRDSKELFVSKVVPHLVGKADLLLIWESGGQEGWRIANGKFSEHEVEFKLGAEVKS